MSKNEIQIMGDVEMAHNHGVLGGAMYVDTNVEFEVK
jgi:formylmethanofuran dehydrogenase subunit C